MVNGDLWVNRNGTQGSMPKMERPHSGRTTVGDEPSTPHPRSCPRNAPTPASPGATQLATVRGRGRRRLRGMRTVTNTARRRRFSSDGWGGVGASARETRTARTMRTTRHSERLVRRRGSACTLHCAKKWLPGLCDKGEPVRQLRRDASHNQGTYALAMPTKAQHAAGAIERIKSMRTQ